jgi:uncharacterized delta-60 repeat protein
METMEPRRLFSIPALDTSFNSTGEILDTFAGGMHATLVSAKVLPGGKILAVGQGIPGGGTQQQLLVARFNTNGTPDNTFNAGTNYRFYNPFNNAVDDYAKGLVLLSDGTFLVEGDTSANDDGFLVKFTAAGNIDTAFGDHFQRDSPGERPVNRRNHPCRQRIRRLAAYRRRNA